MYQVNANGTVALVGKYDDTYKDLQTQTPDMSAKSVTFSASSSAVYGFDAFAPVYATRPAMEPKYMKLGDTYFSAKAITQSATDVVSFKMQGVSLNDIVFVNREGFVFNASGSTLTLVGGPEKDAQEILAVTKTDKKVIGALLLASYPKLKKTVKIVPTDGRVAISTANLAILQTRVNEVFSQVGIEYTLQLDESIKGKWCGDPVCGDVIPSSSGILSNDYTGTEKQVVDFYVSQPGFNASDLNTAYMFVTGNAATNAGDEGNMQGRMNYGKQAGFLYGVTGSSNFTEIGRTLAHELGHGNFQLFHVFLDMYLGPDSTNSKNIMSYSTAQNATKLNKVQWDIVHDPGVVWGVLASDEDQAFAGGEFFVNPNIDQNSTDVLFNYNTSKCKQFFIDNGWLGKFGANEVAEITNVYIDENGYLSYVVGTDDRIYTLSHAVKIEKIDGVETIVTNYSTSSLVCFSCILEDEKNGKLADGVTVDRNVVDENGNSVPIFKNLRNSTKYVVARFVSAEKCAPGKQVLVLNNGTYTCKTLTQDDCIYNSDGSSTGKGVADPAIKVWNLTDIKDNSKILEIENLLKKVFGGGAKNSLTNDVHKIKIGACITSNVSINSVYVRDNKLYRMINESQQEELLNTDGYDVYLLLKYNTETGKISVNGTIINNELSGLLTQYVKQIAENAEWNQASFLQKIGSVTYDVSDTYYQALYDMFDFLSQTVRKVTMPVHVWDPDVENYNKWYGIIFSCVYTPIDLQKHIGDIITSDKLSDAKYNLIVTTWATFCGMYDGLLEVVASVPDILKLVVSPLSEKGREGIVKAATNFAEMEIKETNSQGIEEVVCAKDNYDCKAWGIVKDGVAKQFETPAKGSHFVGSIAGPVIVACFGDAIALTGVLGKITGGAVTFLKWCDKATDIVGFLGKYGKTSLRLIRNKTGALKAAFDVDGTNLIKEVDGNFVVKQVEDGKVVDKVLTPEQLDGVTKESLEDVMSKLTNSLSFLIIIYP
ncbi:MAG: hypothetical protein IPO21_15895 [Bacteroidales bacterium]|nr:hypothetical protein [Bacteroidales bacterium]